MSKTISIKYPEVPLEHYISDGKLEVGDKVELKGEPLENAVRFSVNFIDSSTEQCIFHLDFRFNEEEPYIRTVVRNTNFPYGTWGEEERADNPLQRGESFKIQIKVLEDRFDVEVNDAHSFDFVHRVSLGNANVINIKGDVKIKSVKIKEC
ncbi:32 kDa beta-galactoside-binding lectin lec-3-like [Daphnia pulicaria]|uniref:32 kDa beta-galactoside-binding lectin lec-3-like n=1 Tax=Daphnia pulicaria TaxID=35523 RepID=UPI001EEAF453|nr:32 kDa beta-galactoside-binding lectin lec-3-like [Daphnia pulicaria]XP_046653274.1 32 kDa beta-galactoside-binding lectin lec-3-like [Daphnia pulicaria]